MSLLLLLRTGVPLGPPAGYTVSTLYTIRTLPDYAVHTGFESTSSGEVCMVPSSFGPGQTVTSAAAPGGYGSFRVTPPWGGADIWAIIGAPTSARNG